MKFNKITSIIIVFLIGISSFVYATDHIVISEVLYNAEGSSENGKEWIEIYNPTDSTEDIGLWSLYRNGGMANAFILTFPEGTTLNPYSYLLIGNNGASIEGVVFDFMGFVSPLTNNEDGILLEDSSHNPVDAVGWGFISNEDLFEGTRFGFVGDGNSIERKQGGICGNAIDTQNNSADFFEQIIPNPQNSLNATIIPCDQPQDTTPAAITNLYVVSVTNSSINWSWINPTTNFYQAIIYFNGANVQNTSNNYYYKNGLTADTIYTIRINTQDSTGNVNFTNVTNTTRTLANLPTGCVDDPECDDGLWCNGAEICVTGICQSGTAVICDDGVICTDDSCNEDTDSCDYVANDANCDNSLFCDGAETCDSLLGCQAGTPIDCSGNNEDEISDCSYTPDGLDFTLDYRALFTSDCVEPTGTCTSVDDDDISHTCSIDTCGATCETSDDCDAGYICNLNACSCVLSGELYCGDGIKNLDEECDIDDFDGLTCDDYGHSNGDLVCNGCVIDSSGCFNVDSDGDGIDDEIDNCPLVPNPDQEDLDNDGIGDVCDDDRDSDGILDTMDRCVLDSVNDADEDEYCADVDNCPLIYNEDQSDIDSDGQGDVCDIDADNDGINDTEDVCPYDYYNDADNDGFCADQDSVEGNSSSITSNLDCIEFSVDDVLNPANPSGVGSVVIQDCNGSRITEFDFDFDNGGLDLNNVTINAEDSKIIISGIDLSNQNYNKTVYLDINLGTDVLCVKDEEVLSFSVSGDCDNGDVKLSCDGISGDYECEKIDNNTIYKVTGLKHSAVVEYSYTAPTGGGNNNGPSGSGGSTTTKTCTEAWSCTAWSICDKGTQTRTCTDTKNCGTTENKPEESQSCLYFPKTEQETEPEQIVRPATPKTEEPVEEAEEEQAGIFAITGAFIGSALESGSIYAWIIILIIIIALVIIFILSRRKKGKKKRKNKKGALIFAILLLSLVPIALADSVVISEVLYNPTGPEDKEWIELYNPTDSAIDLSGWKIYSYTNAAPDAVIGSGSVIAPKGFFLVGDVASTEDLDYSEDLYMTNFDSGIQLRNGSDDIIDSVGWGNGGLFYETTPVATVAEGYSIERTLNPDCTIQDTNDNSADFSAQSTPNANNADDVCEAPFCGNDLIEWTEVCDGSDLDGKTCQDYGYSNANTLACNMVDCLSFDISGCSNVCGDGNVEPGEECDDGNNVDWDGCSASCINELVDCGDNVKEGLEVCDGTDLDGKTCTDYGYSNPNTLTCNANCLGFDVSRCSNVCGNGNLEPSEECDDGNNADGDGCSATCNSEYTDDLQINYVRGKILVDGVEADAGFTYEVEVLSGDNAGFIFDGLVDDNVPAVLQDNGYFDTQDQLIFSTGANFKVSSDECTGNYEGIFENGGNGDFNSVYVEFNCVVPPVIGLVAFSDPITELDNVVIEADVTDNLGLDSVLINYTVNGNTVIIDEMTLNLLYEVNLGTFNGGDVIEFNIIANDTYGNVVASPKDTITILHADKDGDGFTSDVDCDDNDDTINPDALEVCDTVDNNCDGNIDEEDADGCSIYYMDSDRDGFGIDDSKCLCAASAPYDANVDSDCDDSEPEVYPGNTEVCDGLDNDCDIATEDGSDETAPDNSKQANICAGSLQSCIAGTWTDDYSLVENYEEVEVSCDGIDNDCDGDADLGVAITYYEDFDDDTYGNAAVSQEACVAPEGYVDNSEDCDDSDEWINPDAEDLCDGIDNDCNIATEDGSDDDAPLNTNQFGVCAGSQNICSGGTWTDDYGLVANLEYPEISCDGLDNNCNNQTDEGLTTTYYLDFDLDGFGNLTAALDACSLPEGYSTDNTDCNDDNDEAYPGNAEVCDGADNNCDGDVDEGFDNMDNDEFADCVDEDIDGDGVNNDNDAYPLDPTRWVDLLGDVNHDNVVDVGDLMLVRRAFDMTSSDPDWNFEYDVNVDSIIDVGDLMIIRRNFS